MARMLKRKQWDVWVLNVEFSFLIDEIFVYVIFFRLLNPVFLVLPSLSGFVQRKSNGILLQQVGVEDENEGRNVIVAVIMLNFFHSGDANLVW